MKIFSINCSMIFQIIFLIILLLFESVISQKYFSLTNDFCERTNLIQQINFLAKSIKHSVELNEDASAVFFEKRLNSSSFKRFKKDCVISIKTEKYDKSASIYVNIVKMKFRQDWSGSCHDSITIKINGQEKFPNCGELNQGQILSFTDYSGEVKITISVDNQLPFDTDDDYLEFAIVATAFTECGYSNPSDVIKCTNSSKSCISDTYRNDGYNNCPAYFCTDEGNRCGYGLPDLEKVPAANPSSIALSAITSLLFTMFGVGACVWLAWNYKGCCGNEPQTRNRRNSNSNTGNQAIEMPTNSGPTTSDPPPPLEDKDLPPTYESLFPER